MQRDARKTKVLLTGAAGRIGGAFFAHAGDRYAFRLADLPGADLPETGGDHEAFVFDASDAAACRKACEGVDAVVHLAADPSPDADFEGSLLANNIVGSFNMFRAAREAGCRRFVVASSIHAVDAYPLDAQVRPEMPVKPNDLYGVSKCFAEALASYYATEEGLPCVAVRIGTFKSPEEHEDLGARELSTFVSPRDLCDLLVRCVEAPEKVRFAIVHGVSDNRFKRLDLTSTRELLGYEPQDDAFRPFFGEPESATHPII